MKLPLPVLGALALFALAPSAAGQGLQRSADPEAAIVQELVVTARQPGPAWWKVSDGDSTVWVIGLPGGLPKDVKWNDVMAKARLAHAHALILPAQVKVSPLKAIGWFLKNRKALRSKTALETRLPPALARDFATARQGLGKDAKRYESWRPAIAGMILGGDFRRAAKLDADEPLGHLRALARRAGVRERRAGSYDGGQLLQSLLTMSEAAEQECLQDSIAEVSAGVGKVRSAAQGWAMGDTRAALAAQRGYDRCLAALPTVSRLLQQSQADGAAAIVQALAQPGDSVAAMDLRSLLARGGVLERLKAQGYKVSAPSGAE